MITSTIASLRSLFLMSLAVWLLGACTLSSGILPEGRQVILNGQFNASNGRPENWILRAGGGLGKIRVIPASAGEPYPVLCIEVVRASEKPWTIELRQQIDSILKKGETLYLTFEYQITAGYAFHLYWQQDTHPWPKYLSLRISEPADQWAKCMVAVPVHDEMPMQSTSLSFHLAESPGTVQFRNFVGIAVPSDVDPQTLETNVEAVFGGDYYDNDWRNAALERLQRTRMTDVEIAVRNADGPVAGANVEMEQKSRDFSFGVEVPAALLAEGALKKKFFGELREKLGNNIGYLPEFRAKVTDRRLFDRITFPSAMMWRMYEAWGSEIVPQAIEVVQAQGLKIRGHALYCPAFHFAPPKCRQMESSELLKTLTDFIGTHVRTFAGKVDQWDVLHGVLTYDEMYDYVGVQSLLDAFRIARENDPKAELLVSDDYALLSPAESHLEELIELVNWLRTEGAEVSGVTLRASLQPPYIAPQAMEKRLDLIAQNCRLPVHIAGLEVAGAKVKTQASMLKDLLLAFYSNADVNSVSFSSLWAAESTDPRTAIYLEDMKRRPAATMIEDLLTKEWWTRTEKLVTDDQGTCRVNAFHGTHKLTVTVNGKRTEMEVLVLPAQEIMPPPPRLRKKQVPAEPPPGQIIEVELK